MKAIAIIGGGIASVGAIARIVEADIGSISRVDQFSAPIRGAKIFTRGDTFRLPNSDERGYFQRWGAVLGLKSFDSRAFRAFADVFLGDEMLYQSELDLESELLSYESDDVPYICLDRSDASDRVSRLVARARKSGFLRQINAQIQELKRSEKGWQVRTNVAIENTTYDHVVLCAGALHTPALLANSGLIVERDSYTLQDHVIQFGGRGETTVENTLRPGSRDIQIVRSEDSGGGYAHDVRFTRMLAFSPRYMEQIFWRIAGRTRRELLTKGQLDLIGILLRATVSGVRFSPNHQNLRITVHDHKSCEASLRIENGEPVIDWSSSLQPGAVSAFHFHGPLNGCPDIPILEDAGIHIGDLSLGRPLKGVNNGCASFQAGFVGMSRALAPAASFLAS